MTAPEFTFKLEEYFGAMSAGESEEWTNRIRRYKDWHLDEIWSWMVEHCTQRPKFAHFYRAATELGIAENVRIDAQDARQRTDCENCGGSGLVQVREDHSGCEYDLSYACGCSNGARWTRIKVRSV